LSAPPRSGAAPGGAREILTVEQMAQADRAAIADGTPGVELMERAGRAVADTVASRYAPRPVVVLAGQGGNGGDGYVAARWLREWGWPVRVEAFAPPRAEDAQAVAARWSGPTTALSPGAAWPGPTGEDALVIDALFGAGLDRPLGPDLGRMAFGLERSKATVVSVDVPSGLSGDTGRALSGLCFKAELTVTFHRRKPAHVLQPGRGFCGEVVVADIGLGTVGGSLFENTPDLWSARFPWPDIGAHKHTRGRLIVFSGEAWNTGAARLAARAGLRVGAGLVTLLSPPEALMINAAHLEAIMLKAFETDLDVEAAGADADCAIIGPAAGVTDATLTNVLALARTGAALVIDADALTVFRDDPAELFSILDRDDVLTPHQGEFERVFPGLLKASPERISATRAAAARSQSVVLLKGPDTVIAASDGRAAVNMNGVPWLATAGSGDVLAGLIGGLIAQGMESFEAACAGVWIHAACAEAFGPGLISEDLPGLTPLVLKRLRA
jgi:hydroxyethylthiazole kinase-like uncharacterized protein yjeF